MESLLNGVGLRPLAFAAVLNAPPALGLPWLPISMGVVVLLLCVGRRRGQPWPEEKPWARIENII